MGHDFVIIDSYGNIVGKLYRHCSGNWSDMWKEHKTGPYVWQGHSGRTILHNINQAINSVVACGAQVILPDTEENPDFYWGVIYQSGETMTGQQRLDAFYAWLRVLKEIAEYHLEHRWYSDQVFGSISPYNCDGYESEGQDDPRNESDSD